MNEIIKKYKIGNLGKNPVEIQEWIDKAKGVKGKKRILRSGKNVIITHTPGNRPEVLSPKKRGGQSTFETGNIHWCS